MSLKIDIKDLEKVVELAKKLKIAGDVKVEILPNNNAITFCFFDSFNQDSITVQIFPSEINQFAQKTVTTRL